MAVDNGNTEAKAKAKSRILVPNIQGLYDKNYFLEHCKIFDFV